MDILDGTDTRGPIRLEFTHEEFNDLCDTLCDTPGCKHTWNACPTYTPNPTRDKILRFRQCSTDKE